MAALSADFPHGFRRYDCTAFGIFAASLSSAVRRSDSSVVANATTVLLKRRGPAVGSRQVAASWVEWQPARLPASAARATRCRASDVFMIDPPRFIWVVPHRILQPALRAGHWTMDS